MRRLKLYLETDVNLTYTEYVEKIKMIAQQLKLTYHIKLPTMRL